MANPTGSLLLRNVHYLEGEELVLRRGTLQVSRIDGEITLNPQQEPTSGVSWQLEGGGDPQYLIIPAMRNTVEIGIPVSLAGDHVAQFFTQEELDTVSASLLIVPFLPLSWLASGKRKKSHADFSSLFFTADPFSTSHTRAS